MKTTIKKAFARHGIRLARGPKSRSGGKQRETVCEYSQHPFDGTWDLCASRTAPKRVLGRCYRNLAREL